jgi:DNA-binding CsgD family transcriptional regulator
MLTRRENQILAYTAAGLSVKEIADHIHRSEFTVQKTICNVKTKTGLQKATELVALYFCQRIGCDFGDFKRQVLSVGMAILMLCAELGLQTEFVRFRSRQHNTRASVYRNKRNEDFNHLYNRDYVNLFFYIARVRTFVF